MSRESTVCWAHRRSTTEFPFCSVCVRACCDERDAICSVDKQKKKQHKVLCTRNGWSWLNDTTLMDEFKLRSIPFFRVLNIEMNKKRRRRRRPSLSIVFNWIWRWMCCETLNIQWLHHAHFTWMELKLGPTEREFDSSVAIKKRLNCFLGAIWHTQLRLPRAQDSTDWKWK